jgi:nucleoid DNA-binding protein
MATKPKPVSTIAKKPAASKSAAPKVVKSTRSVATPVAKTTPVAPKVAAPSAISPAVAAPKTNDMARSNAASANANSLKKKDLIDRVLKVTGGKKKVVRDVVEATLNVLGDALSKGEMLNLPPFGKAKVSRPSDVGSGKAMTVKLRRGPGNGGKAKQAIADDDE